jgi:hypothetical protein
MGARNAFDNDLGARRRSDGFFSDTEVQTAAFLGITGAGHSAFGL